MMCFSLYLPPQRDSTVSAEQSDDIPKGSKVIFKWEEGMTRSYLRRVKDVQRTHTDTTQS